MSSKDAKAAAVDAADDLDDLDDILDEFNAPAKPTVAKPTEDVSAQQSSTKAAAAEGATNALSGAHDTSVSVGDEDAEGETEDDLNEQFAKEFAQGMEALMKGVDPTTLAAQTGGNGSTDAGGDGEEGGEGLMNEEEMMRQFEQMMADMGFGGAPPTGAGGSSTSSGATASSSTAGVPPAPANFQDAIRNTMSRLRESDQTATSSAGQANEMDFEKLLAAFGNGEGGEGGEEGIAQMLENMMGELMSKEVLYDPLKELRDKYPGYLANPPKPISDEDRARYEDQHRIVKAVIAVFDNPKFDNGTDAEKQALKSQVQSLMNEMQDSGSPPTEIIGDLPPELENMPGMNDENCTIM